MREAMQKSSALNTRTNIIGQPLTFVGKPPSFSLPPTFQPRQIFAFLLEVRTRSSTRREARVQDDALRRFRCFFI